MDKQDLRGRIFPRVWVQGPRMAACVETAGSRAAKTGQCG
jgi:hypothetical protein